ncbi:hypothetical protein IFM89_018992 [Coptis chinensis]|uniref:Uncharacterized protein n=1 Tax=Coptis chinensis TaxID=261450 RepID=A0A835ID57_9MAGN|nr:hypothetical protein IFM89_018992 [Coptis chinensis]
MGIDRLLISPRTSVERNEELGCLAGVLEGVGDNICTFDMSSTGGSKILNGYKPAFDELCSRMGHGGGYLAGVVAVVCHEVPMDMGTSESLFLGAGSPLHSIVSYCTVPYKTRESIERFREFSNSIFVY